ncbi:unnamed protein product, partial [Symbiodinium sp. CCMP2456]
DEATGRDPSRQNTVTGGFGEDLKAEVEQAQEGEFLEGEEEEIEEDEEDQVADPEIYRAECTPHKDKGGHMALEDAEALQDEKPGCAKEVKGDKPAEQAKSAGEVKADETEQAKSAGEVKTDEAEQAKSAMEVEVDQEQGGKSHDAAKEHEGLKVKSKPVPRSLAQAAEELAAKIEKEAEGQPSLLE